MGINKKYIFKILLMFLFISPLYSHAQQYKYLVYFKDKNSSPFSLSNPTQFLSTKALDRRAKQNISLNFQDLPVNPSYVSSVAGTGAQVLYTSKWLNAALVLADVSQVTAINALPFVSSSMKSSRKTKLNSALPTEINLLQSSLSIDYGTSYNQISMLGVDQMHDDGYTGKGVLIAVIDGGFQDANILSVFDSIYMNNRVIATYDFVDNETDVYDDHFHGTHVLSLMAAYESGSIISGAWESNYILLRSEDANVETLNEEANWIIAAEYADSAGADIINSSLGYNTFDDPSFDHTYADMNGNTTIISKAADIAASKGILVVTAAGNYGNTSWQYIIAPADADSVLAVGAVNPLGNYYFVSSKGPSSDGRIKPDVAAQGNSVVVASVLGGVQTGNGTSYATPQIAGLAAGLWEAFPSLSNMDLHYFIRRSASQYNNPDNLLGYGIPNYSKAKEMILSHSEHITIFPNPVGSEPLILNLPKSETGNEIRLRFTDITGKNLAEETIVSGEYRNEIKTNMSQWTHGIYLLTVLTPEQKYVFKILKN